MTLFQICGLEQMLEGVMRKGDGIIISWSLKEMANSTGSMESDLTFEELLCFLVVWKPSHVV